MTITLDDELVESAARAIFMDSFPAMEKEGMWGDAGEKMEMVRAVMRSNARAAITAYLQGAVDAGKAVQDHMSELEELWVLDFAGARRSFPVLILRLPPQNPSSAESSAGTDGNSANK
jgi:hypothetical protein